MQDLLSKAELELQKIQENARYALKQLRAARKSFDKGHFQKLGSLIQNPRFEKASRELGLEYLSNQLSDRHQKYVAGLRMNFDKNFLSACEEHGLRDVKGNSMSEFQVRGILRLKVTFHKNTCEIATFVRSKKIQSLDPVVVCRELREETKRLFERPFDPKEFLRSLFHAYQRVRNESRRTVPLKDIHRILWTARQNDNFFETSDPKKLVSYPLDEFSVDLQRLLESGVHTLEDGYSWKISLGSGGVNIYGSNGEFNSYKYLEFVKE